LALIFGNNFMAQRIEEKAGFLLRDRGLKLAVAESCTGGLLGARITSVGGSSDWFLGGIISYSNEVKIQELGVPREMLTEHGAVSEPVARRMATGARRRIGADLAVAITGVAGPTGGTPPKPVGLVFIALADRRNCVVGRFNFSGGRAAVRKSATDAAIRMLLSHLNTNKGE
jgi:PncC family amidohydrolase